MGTYQWKEGSRVSGDVEKIGRELEAISPRTPQNVELAAQKKRSAMHQCFAWDNDRAAYQWRLQQARGLINAIVIVADDDDAGPIEIPAYESVIIEKERQYVSTIESVSDDEIWDQIKGEARSSIVNLQRKLKIYEHLRREQAGEAQQHLELARKALTV